MNVPGVGKWAKHKIMKQHSELVKHLPEMQLLNKTNGIPFLLKHNSAFIKPTNNYGGNHVIKIKQLPNKSFQVQDGMKILNYADEAAMRAYLIPKAAKNFLIQQGIALAKVNGQPFDLRIMVQRHSSVDPWVVTGILAKIAGKGYVITNIKRSGGHVQNLDKTLTNSNLKSINTADLKLKLKKLALAAAAKLQVSYPWSREIGLDVGVDEKGHIWIIEANLLPMRELFLRLADKSAYKLITSFKRK